MFRTVFVAFWILHCELTAYASQKHNVVVLSETPSASHPFLTGAKFLPFKPTPFEGAAAKPETIVPSRTASPPAQPIPQGVFITAANVPDRSASSSSEAQAPPPLNRLPAEQSFDNLSEAPLFDSKKLAVADQASPVALLPAPPVNAGDILPPINVAESKTVAVSDAAAPPVAVPSAVELPPPVPIDESKNVAGVNGAAQLTPVANPPSDGGSAGVGQTSSDQPSDDDPPTPVAGLPFPNVVFDPQITLHRKLLPPQPPSAVATDAQPAATPDDQLLPPLQSSSVAVGQPKNAIAVAVQPPDVQLTAPNKLSPAAPKLAVEILPPLAENAAEVIVSQQTNGYGGVVVAAAASAASASSAAVAQQTLVQNESVAAIKDDLPLVFQRLVDPSKSKPSSDPRKSKPPSDPRKSKEHHSPKTDVEVFAPLQPEQPAQPPPPPSPPVDYPDGSPVYPLPAEAGGQYPYGPPFVFNEYPAYPPLMPEEPATIKPFAPRYPGLLPTTRSADEFTRPTEETTRATEETTPRTQPPPTPKNTPRPPPKATPWPPKNTPWQPKNTPPRPPVYNAPGEHAWTTRFYPGYPPTSKIPKGMPSPIWPAFMPRPIVQSPPPPPANPSGMVTPFMEKLISATSTAATPTVQILGEPSLVDPKYKLAVVSDYKNYDMKEGTFGFKIDLENGLTAKVRGYKKDGRHVIEGSYSLFANEGEPVNITYIADNEVPDSKSIPFEQKTTDAVPLDDAAVTPSTET